MTIEPQHATVFVEGLKFGEGPRWHQGRLWYSDFFSATVNSVDESGDVRIEHHVPDEPSGLGWLPDGRLLVVARQTRSLLVESSDGTLIPYADLGPLATFHGNDMVVDSVGRAYVGNFGFDLDTFIEEHGQVALIEPPGPPRTSLIRVDPDGSVTEASPDMQFPNGSVITPDGTTLIVAETLAGHLSAFHIQPNGDLSDRRVWGAIPWCAPDGICLNDRGHVWVANAVAPECLLVAEGGEVIDRIVTSQLCFACMLGGEDGRTLFMMTAPSSTASEVKDITAGRIERARVTDPGAGLP